MQRRKNDKVDTKLIAIYASRFQDKVQYYKRPTKEIETARIQTHPVCDGFSKRQRIVEGPKELYVERNERQRKFEQEEQEAKARGAFTPQECYANLSADYADVLQRSILVCVIYKTIGEAVKQQEARSREVKAGCPFGKQEVQAEDVKTFPSRAKRFRNAFAYQFKNISLYFPHRAYRSTSDSSCGYTCSVFG